MDLKHSTNIEVNSSSGVNEGAKYKRLLRWWPLIVLVLVLGLFGALFGKKAIAVFDPISVVATVSGVTLEETDGRINILVLGSDKRSSGVATSELTDTILVVSIGKMDKNVVLISLPRDLWVESSFGFHKINETYARGGVGELKTVLEDVLGIPIHYHVVVNFELFRDVIDIVGGVGVTVDRAFSDYYYPVEGHENDTCGRTMEEIEQMKDESLSVVFSCRYTTITFSEGYQVMDGEAALKYVRSRKGNNDEGTDFARAKRQQKVIMAIKDKLFSLETLVNPKKLRELYDIYASQVDTNVNLATVQQFYLLSQQIHFDAVRTIVLDDRSAASSGGLLYAPMDTSLYGGAYVLIPRAGDFSQVRAYVQKYIFEF